MNELLKLSAPRPWSVDVSQEDQTVTIVDADGFEVCQLWYNCGDGPTPNRASSPYDAIALVEAVNALGGGE
jgi:hypothetical protein